jgi:hypothetical protein
MLSRRAQFCAQLSAGMGRWGWAMPKPKEQAQDKPHDELFKKTFGEIRHARALLQRILPAAIVPLFDWGTLRGARACFITDELRERQGDLLFSVTLRASGALAFILLEHQSSVELGMPQRLLGYMVGTWGLFQQECPKAKQLPPIVSVVVHNGRWGWRRSPSFRALYDLPPSELDALLPHLVDFAFSLSDLRQMRDEELLAKATPVEGLMLHCLAHYNEPERLLAGLGRWIRVVRRVETAGNAEAALRAATRYICGVPSGRNRELARKLSGLMAAEGEEKIVGTIAELWLDEGGTKATRALLQRMLTVRFGPVGDRVKARIGKADVAVLTRWAEQLMTAGKVADVFRAPANGARKTKAARVARATRRG